MPELQEYVSGKPGSNRTGGMKTMDWKKNKWLRTLRRFATVFIVSGIAVIGVEQTMTLKYLLVMFAIGGLAGLEKYLRDKDVPGSK